MSEDKDSVKKNVRGSLSSLKPELVIGTRVKVQMINNNEAEGEIFTLDDTAGMLVLSTFVLSLLFLQGVTSNWALST